MFDLGIFALLLGLFLVFFKPGLLFSMTTTTGGDTAAHIYALPLLPEDAASPEGDVRRMVPRMVRGFPMLHFYFPLVATFQAVLSWLIPYEISFCWGRF